MIVAIYIHSLNNLEFLALTEKKVRKQWDTPLFLENEGVLNGKASIAQNLKKIVSELDLKPEDTIAVFSGACPFFDRDLSFEILAEHERYISHFTYSENIPSGFVPDFISVEYIHLLPDSCTDVREFSYKNINDFDIDIFFKHPDLRQWRLDFSAKTNRSAFMVREILKIKENLSFDTLEEFIKNHSSLISPFPSYFEIELTTETPLTPCFTPLSLMKQNHTTLNLTLVHKLITQIQDSGSGMEVAISFAGLGDPLYYQDFDQALTWALRTDSIHTVFIETFGTSITEAKIQSWAKLPGSQKIHIIIKLSTMIRERYIDLYGKDMFQSVMDGIDLLQQMDHPFHLFIEVLKIKDNEDEIDKFYEQFEPTKFQIILQKFNTYIHLLPERRVSDLTPLVRDFCWHLARDFYLTSGGNISICKQDPFGKISMDFRNISIVDYWKNSRKFFECSIQGRHGDIPLPCLSCDEWYTFNG